MSGVWTTIESDPGVFTELIGQIGIKGVQVEELYDLETSSLEKLKPIYGLIFLFKWQKDEKDNRSTTDSSSVFFAKQTVPNACATQAILNILLNRPEVSLGKEIEQFKTFAQELPPEYRGVAIGNSEMIRVAHNSFARPEPFHFEEKDDKDDKDDEAFHFIGYVPIGGQLYELDGLKHGPIKLGECNLNNWLEKVKPVIETRIAKYSAKEIRFNLLALCANRKDLYTTQLATEQTTHDKLVNDIKAHSNTANSNSNSNAMDTKEDNRSKAELETALTAVDGRISQLRESIAAEDTKFKAWKAENVRRRHNYVPFVFHLLKALAERDKLKELQDKATKVAAERHTHRQAQKEKDKQKEKDAKDKDKTTTTATATAPKK